MRDILSKTEYSEVDGHLVASGKVALPSFAVISKAKEEISFDCQVYCCFDKDDEYV